MQYVFAVEGFCGYPYKSYFSGKTQNPQEPRSRADLLFGLGPAQVYNFVLPIINELPETTWFYYPQLAVLPIIAKIRKILRKEPNAKIALLGFSYGGSAIHAVSHAFRQENVFDLAISLDPVRKWRINVAPESAKVYRFRKPKSVKRWVNLYQRIDKFSFAPSHPWLRKAIWGGKVAGADQETEILLENFQPSFLSICGPGKNFAFPQEYRFSDQAHLWFPAHNEVLRQIRHEFEILFGNTPISRLGKV